MAKDFPFSKGAFKPFGINIKISWKKDFFFFIFSQDNFGLICALMNFRHYSVIFQFLRE